MLALASFRMTFPPLRRAVATGPPRLLTISGGSAFNLARRSSRPCRVRVSAIRGSRLTDEIDVPRACIVERDALDVEGGATGLDEAHGLHHTRPKADPDAGLADRRWRVGLQ